MAVTLCNRRFGEFKCMKGHCPHALKTFGSSRNGESQWRFKRTNCRASKYWGLRTKQTKEILTPEALKFVVDLERRFGPRRRELLAARVERQKRLDAGERPDFLPQTAEIRNGNWSVAPLPADLLDRRVEITGPVDRKMIINALNSGASVFMADFEDSNTPPGAT